MKTLSDTRGVRTRACSVHTPVNAFYRTATVRKRSPRSPVVLALAALILAASATAQPVITLSYYLDILKPT